MLKLLTAIIILSLALVLLGFAVPERFALLGIFATATLFIATVTMGMVQLYRARRKAG